MTSLRLATIASFVAFAASASACGASAPAATMPASEAPSAGAVARAEGEHIWRSKCGSCHTPVDPGSHARGQIVEALSRHRTRLRLASTQWQAVTEFLAPDR